MKKVSYRRFERLTAGNRLQPCVLISVDGGAKGNFAFDFDTDSDIQIALDVLAELDARCASHGHKGFEFGGNPDEAEISFNAIGDFPAHVFHFSDRNAFDSAFAAAVKLGELFNQMPKQSGARTDLKPLPTAGNKLDDDSDSDDEEPPQRPKLEVAKELGEFVHGGEKK